MSKINEKDPVLELLLTMLKKIETNIANSNRGGCAVIAYAVVKRLKVLAPKARIKVYYLFEDDELEQESYENIKNGVPDSCGHAVIKYKGLYLDTDGTYKNKRSLQQSNRWFDGDMITSIPFKLLLKSINLTGWNKRFCRESSIPKLANILSIDLSEIRVA